MILSRMEHIETNMKQLEMATDSDEQECIPLKPFSSICTGYLDVDGKWNNGKFLAILRSIKYTTMTDSVFFLFRFRLPDRK